jgi:hypothetical protein
MKFSSLPLKIAVCSLVLSFSPVIIAGPARTPAQAGISAASEADLLRQAYVILSHGDHDYKGHRVKAMHSVEAASKLLGVKLTGDGRGHESQATSDGQLETARIVLAEVVARPAIKKESRVVKHVETAINEIDAALKIK